MGVIYILLFVMLFAMYRKTIPTTMYVISIYIFHFYMLQGCCFVCFCWFMRLSSACSC